MAQDIYPVSVILAFLSLAILLIDLPPLLWHSKNRNYAAASLIFWIILLNFFNFLNAVIWPSDETLITPGYYSGEGLCDIEVKLEVGSWAALPGTLASIMWNLARVMNTNRPIIPSQAEKRRQFAIDMLLSWGFPIYLMIIHYVVQSNRYYLWGISGCNPSLDNSWVSIVLVFIWPLVLAVVGAYFAIVLVVRMRKYRRDLGTILQSHNTTKSRFMRLFAMSLIMIAVFTPVQVYILLVNAAPPLHAYSWSGVHGPMWNDIDAGKVPSYGNAIFDRWIRIAAGILVFLFFGIGRDARDMYNTWLKKVGLGGLVIRMNRSGRSGNSSWSSLSEKAKGLLFYSKNKTAQSSEMTDESKLTHTSSSSKSGSISADSAPKKSIFEVITSGGNLYQHGQSRKKSDKGLIRPLAVRSVGRQHEGTQYKRSTHSPAITAALQSEQ